MREQIRQIISTHIQKEAYQWLEDTSGHLHDAALLYRAFAQVPRKVGKISISSCPPTDVKQTAFEEGHYFENWSADRLCRVYLLASYVNADMEAYHKVIEQLFVAADVNELVALYSSLPVLDYPESWTKRCAEGIRSNMGSVLEAIMYYNPYPAGYLELAAWNQMILKAFFTDKQLTYIKGLQKRNNRELTLTLSDYVHERWAAGRVINPIIWLLIGQFAEDVFMNDFATVLSGNDEAAKKFLKNGVALSGFLPAKQLMHPANAGTIQTL
jgi:hypothetical protein